MRKFSTSLTYNLSVIFISMFFLFGTAVGLRQANSEESNQDFLAEENSYDFVTEKAKTAIAKAPTFERPKWEKKPPALTPERRAELERLIERTHPPGPVVEGLQVPVEVGPEPGTETILPRRRSMEPRAPGTATLFQNVNFGSVIPANKKINIMESSVGVDGKNVFFTGNLFAARSTDGGVTWTYADPSNPDPFDPTDDFATFCCDQVTIYDESRNLRFWLRQGSEDVNHENVFKLGVSSNGGLSFCTYTYAPTDVDPNWTGRWWDFPHMQLGADYLYITYNLHFSMTSFDRSVILRFPLDSLALCAGFEYNYYDPEYPTWFTLVPVQGAHHTMYFASNWPMSTYPQNSTIGIWRWHEDSTTDPVLFVRTVTSWTFTVNDGVCGGTNGNWVSRVSSKLLAGARYCMMGTDIKRPGRMVLAWWWNVKEGGGFPYPYINGAAFYEDGLVQVGGGYGRPYIWSSASCFAYPSAASNKRGDLGLIFHFGPGQYKNPCVGYIIVDDFTKILPSRTAYTVRTSNSRPSTNTWGDYNTVREFEPTQKVWVAGSHYLPTTNGAAPAPVYFVFGRERDYQSWNRWRNK